MKTCNRFNRFHRFNCFNRFNLRGGLAAAALCIVHCAFCIALAPLGAGAATFDASDRTAFSNATDAAAVFDNAEIVVKPANNFDFSGSPFLFSNAVLSAVGFGTTSEGPKVSGSVLVAGVAATGAVNRTYVKAGDGTLVVRGAAEIANPDFEVLVAAGCYAPETTAGWGPRGIVAFGAWQHTASIGLYEDFEHRTDFTGERRILNIRGDGDFGFSAMAGDVRLRFTDHGTNVVVRGGRTTYAVYGDQTAGASVHQFASNSTNLVAVSSCEYTPRYMSFGCGSPLARGSVLFMNPWNVGWYNLSVRDSNGDPAVRFKDTVGFPSTHNSCQFIVKGGALQGGNVVAGTETGGTAAFDADSDANFRFMASNSGRALFNGDVNYNIEAMDGGTVGGTGRSRNAVTIDAGGRFEPGENGGAFTVAGNFTMQAGSSILVDCIPLPDRGWTNGWVRLEPSAANSKNLTLTGPIDVDVRWPEENRSLVGSRVRVKVLDWAGAPAYRGGAVPSLDAFRFVERLNPRTGQPLLTNQELYVERDALWYRFTIGQGGTVILLR